MTTNGHTEPLEFRGKKPSIWQAGNGKWIVCYIDSIDAGMFTGDTREEAVGQWNIFAERMKGK